MTQQRSAMCAATTSGAITAAAFVLLVAAAAGAAPDATIVIESRTLRAGDLTFAVRLDTETQVAATLNDIVFPPDAPIAARSNGRPECRVNPDISKHGTAFAFQPPGCASSNSCTAVRSLIVSFDNVDPIESASPLYSCALAAETPPGRYTLRCANAAASNPSGMPVDTACVGGEVVVEAGTVLQVGFYYAVQGDIVPVEVTMHSNQAPVRIAADLLVSQATPIRGVGQPACVARGDGLVGSFTFIPDHCTPGEDCTGVHAVLESTSGMALSSGSLLFTCGVEIPSDATPHTYGLQIANGTGVGAGGAPVDIAGQDGAVVVDMRPPTQPPDPSPTPARSTIEISSVSGVPGSTVHIAATLHTDEVIAGLQNDLHVGLPAAIAAAPDGRPACTPDPSVDWLGPEFAFQPPACTPGVDCTGIRAVLLSAQVPQPIVDGTVLYTCAVTIAAGTSGHADLHCSKSLGSTPDGQPLPVGCTDGRVDIVSRDPTPTSTPPLPLNPTPTLASGSSLQSSGGHGGCQIGAATDAPWWLVLAPLAFALRPLLWRASRRQRHARDQSHPSHPAGGDGAPPST